MSDAEAKARALFDAHMALFGDAPPSETEYAALWADDAVVEMPYTTSGTPERIEGKAAVVRYLRGLPGSAQNWRFSTPAFDVTADGDVFFVSFEGEAFVPYTGKTYRQHYLIRITRRGDQMVHYREYRNPVAIADAFIPPRG